MQKEYPILIVLISLLGVSSYGVGVIYAQNATGGFMGDILELSNTLFLVAIPAVVGLIVAIGNVIGQISKNKKFNEGWEVAKNGMMTAVTYGQKTDEMLRKWGPFVEIGLKNLTPEQQRQLERVGLTVDYIEATIEASADQINNLKKNVPDFANPDTQLVAKREQDILTRRRRISGSTSGSNSAGIDG